MLCYRFSSAKRYGCSRAAGTGNLPPNGRIASAQAVYHPMGVLPQPYRQFTTQWAYYLSPTSNLPPNGRITSAQLASQPAQPTQPPSQPALASPAQPSQPASQPGSQPASPASQPAS